MQKQTFVKKNQSVVPGISQNDLKENCLARSSYISTDMMGESLGR
jgi:hypothetical protein